MQKGKNDNMFVIHTEQSQGGKILIHFVIEDVRCDNVP